MTATGLASPPIPAIRRAGGDPLFRSAHQALLFAFTYGDTSHAQAAAAERAIALQARDRYERLPGAGRGLRGQDGAAQAGMIQSTALRAMSPLCKVVTVARFRILDTTSRQAACGVLAVCALGTSSVMPALRQRPWTMELLIRRHFGMRISIDQIADREGVNPSTVWRWQNDLRRWIRRLEDRAMGDAEHALREAGIIW